MSKAQAWKKGRGKLGVFAPLLGSWVAEQDSPRGPTRCERHFTTILDGAYVQLVARWEMPGLVYTEHALFGAPLSGPSKKSGTDADGAKAASKKSGDIGFWSFTSDRKRSEGYRVDAEDLPQPCLVFEAEMPAGLARQAYWLGEDGGFHWVVESKTKRGWNRFVEHRYLPLASPQSTEST